MAAQAKFPNLKPADILNEAPASAPNILRPEFDAHRRRLSVSEKLAEGRGFWRGVFVGVSFGAAAGFSGSIAMMNVWVPQIMNVATQAWVASSAIAGSTSIPGAQLSVRAPNGQSVVQPSITTGGPAIP
jgi:hypothetical protein